MILRAMADGEHTLNLKITLGDQALSHLKARAAKLGQTLDDTVGDIVAQQLFAYDDYDWGDDPENDPRTASQPAYDPSSQTYSLQEVMAQFDAELDKRLASRR